MDEITSAAVKAGHIRAVYGIISDKGRVSRLEISNATGLSLMTVGKITDALAEKKVIVYESAKTCGAGRKASVAGVRRDVYFAVFEVTEKNIFFDVYKCDGELICSVRGNESDIFEKAVMLFVERELVGKILCAAVISEDESGDFSERVKRELGIEAVSLCDSTYLAALGYLTKNKAENLLYIIGNRGVYLSSADSSPICGEITDGDAVAAFFKTKPVYAEGSDYARLGALYLGLRRYITK